ncbi:Pathogenesis-related protein 10.5, putative [Theobroma cacao]|uniref:Pathogenesis-related protein 10.5, putative n=1 Tax=Theobroma cacao TaxID=3641 RepID=A0A061FR26_THECC|nr:Pathogenesis-related protein 10.5, putative [Theobroma cacao]
MKWRLLPQFPPAKMFKAFVLDADNLIPKVVPQAIKSSELLEGDGGPGSIKKITFGEDQLRVYDTGFVAGPDGGSVCKSTSKYYTIGDNEIKEEQIKTGKERAFGMYKAVEAYLLANPAYN